MPDWTETNCPAARASPLATIDYIMTAIPSIVSFWPGDGSNHGARPVYILGDGCIYALEVLPFPTEVMSSYITLILNV
jgi:hypothetical protein